MSTTRRHYHDPYMADRCSGCAELRDRLARTHGSSQQPCGALAAMFALGGALSASAAGLAVWAVLRARRHG